MMAIAFNTKKEAQSAVPFGEEKVIETSFFGKEFRDGEHSVVVSKQPDRVRKTFARIVVKEGKVIKVS